MAHHGANPPSPVDEAADEALVPSTSRVVYTHNTRNNYFVNLESFTTAHQVVVDVLRGHPLYTALSMTVQVPDIYLQQLWYTVDVETREEEFRQLLHLDEGRPDGGDRHSR